MHKKLLILILIVLSFQTDVIGQQNSTYIKAGLLYDSKNNTLLKNKLYLPGVLGLSCRPPWGVPWPIHMCT